MYASVSPVMLPDSAETAPRGILAGSMLPRSMIGTSSARDQSTFLGSA